MIKILIDAREMAHPEPLEKGISALRELDKDSYIYMLNQQNPIPLINLAKQHGFHVLSYAHTENDWHILISHMEEDSMREMLDV